MLAGPPMSISQTDSLNLEIVPRASRTIWSSISLLISLGVSDYLFLELIDRFMKGKEGGEEGGQLSRSVSGSVRQAIKVNSWSRKQRLFSEERAKR